MNIEITHEQLIEIQLLLRHWFNRDKASLKELQLVLS